MKTLEKIISEAKAILSEAYATAGFGYEQTIQDRLNDAGIGVKGKKTAGSSHGADAYLTDSKGKTHGVEVKLSPNVFAGQKNCQYSMKSGDWSWTNPDDLTDFYDEVKLMNKILTKASDKLHAQMNLLGTDRLPFTMSNLDYSRFRKDEPDYTPELAKFDMSPEAIYKNYTQKGVNYIQIGEGYGFYYLAADPLGLAKIGVTQFKPETVQVRTRLKWGGSTFDPKDRALTSSPKAKKTSQVAFNNGLILSGVTASGIDLDKDEDLQKVRKALGYK